MRTAKDRALDAASLDVAFQLTNLLQQAERFGIPADVVAEGEKAIAAYQAASAAANRDEHA